MLSAWVDTKWQRQTDGTLLGQPQEPLPSALLALDKRRGNEPLDLSERARNGAEIKLLAGLGYSGTHGLAMDVQMFFNPQTHCFRILAAEAEVLSARWLRAVFTARSEMLTAKSGIGGKQKDQPISFSLARRIFPNTGGYLVSEDESLWCAPGLAEPNNFELPSAVIFHSVDLPKPTTLVIEPTTACNFRCSFCYGRHLKQGVMRLPAFLDLLENLPSITAVEFTGEGEPLLNKDVPDMIRAFKARGSWVHLTTNGSRMTPERAAMIHDLRVDSVSTSLESLDAERFSYLRPGGDLTELQQAVAMLVSERKARGYGPEILLWVTLLRSSIDEIDAFLDYAEQAGFARVEFQTLNQLAAYQRFYSDELKAEILSEADLVAHRAKPSTSPRSRQVISELLDIHSGRRCDIFMHSTMVYWQGDVTPCRLLKVPQHPNCGNARQTPLTQIWKGSSFAKFRFALQHGIILNACDGCSSVSHA